MSLQVAPVCDGRFGRSIPSQEEGRKEGRRKPFVEQIKRRAAGGDADTRPATSRGDQDEAFGELVSWGLRPFYVANFSKNMLFGRYLSILSMTSLKQYVECFNFRCKIQLDLLVLKCDKTPSCYYRLENFPIKSSLLCGRL